MTAKIKVELSPTLNNPSVEKIIEQNIPNQITERIRKYFELNWNFILWSIS